MRSIAIYSLSAAAISIATSSLAQQGDTQVTAAQACAAMSDMIERATCYDRIFAEIPAATTPSAQDAETDLRNETYPGMQWSVTQRRSEMTDKMNVAVATDSIRPISCGRYNDFAPLELVLQCRENTSTLIFAQRGCFFGSGGNYGEVQYRLDSQPAKRRSFRESSNREALGLWSGARSIPMIKEMLGKDRLLVRIIPVSEAPIEAEFDISNLEARITPLREACGW